MKTEKNWPVTVSLIWIALILAFTIFGALTK
jgi:hypothetical protein